MSKRSAVCTATEYRYSIHLLQISEFELHRDFITQPAVIHLISKAFIETSHVRVYDAIEQFVWTHVTVKKKQQPLKD